MRRHDLTAIALLAALAAVPAIAQTKPPSEKTQLVEDEFWKRVDGGDQGDYEAYLDAYPQGRYIILARYELARLRRQARPVAAPPVTNAPPGQAAVPASSSAPAMEIAPTLHPAMQELLAREPNFKVPAAPAAAQAIQYQGMRKDWGQTADGKFVLQTNPVNVRVYRDPGQAVCHTHISVAFRNGTRDNHLLTWAGALTMAMRQEARLEGKAPQVYSFQLQYTRPQQPLFPLTTGNTFNLSASIYPVNEAGTASAQFSSTMQWQCTAEAPTSSPALPAEVISAGAALIPLRCEVSTSIGANTLPVERRFYWIEKVGCFVPGLDN